MSDQRTKEQVEQNRVAIQDILDKATKPSELDALIGSISDDDLIVLEIASTGEVIKVTKAELGSSIVFTADTNNYASILPPQLFNPDAGEVVAGTGDYIVSNSNPISFVTVNGQVIASSEYSLLGSVATVTPDNGFSAITDEVLIFQFSFSTVGTGGVVNNYRTISASDTLLSTDYLVYCSALLTLNFLTAIGNGGKTVIIKNTSETETVTLDGFGTETIEGELTQELLPGDSYTLSSDGANWNLI